MEHVTVNEVSDIIGCNSRYPERLHSSEVMMGTRFTNDCTRNFKNDVSQNRKGLEKCHCVPYIIISQDSDSRNKFLDAKYKAEDK